MFESAFASVADLAATFKAGEKHYLSPAYQEQEARRDFIDRFFTALGWDVISRSDASSGDVRVVQHTEETASPHCCHLDETFAFRPIYLQ